MTVDSIVMHLRQPVYIRNEDIGLYARSTNVAPVPSWSDRRALPALPVRYAP